MANLFNLSIFENAQDNDDLMNTSINEGSDEFDTNSYAQSGTNGIKGASISIPSGTEIDAEVYNKALTQLQNSFNEASQIFDMLKNVDPVSITLESRQAAFTEAYVEEAIYNSILDGPAFEAVNSADKYDVKNIIRKIVNDVAAEITRSGNKFSKPQKLLRFLLMGGTSGEELKTNGSGKISVETKTAWNTRLWSVLGVLYCDPDDESTIIEGLNSKFATELGEYKIKTVSVNGGILDLFRTKFGYKNNKKGFWMLIDKPVSKPSVKELEKAIKQNMAIDDKK